MLRGRETVRADRRLRTDEKHIRAQSTILYKNHPKPPWFLFITVSSVRMCFSSARKTRLARAARRSCLCRQERKLLKLPVGYCAQARGRNQLHVFREQAASVTRFGRLPFLAPRREFLRRDVEL